MIVPDRPVLTMNSARTVAQPFASLSDIPSDLRDHLLRIAQLGYQPDRVAKWYLALYKDLHQVKYGSDASPNSEISTIAPERQASSRSHPHISLAEEMPELTSSSSMGSNLESIIYTAHQTPGLLQPPSDYLAMFDQSSYGNNFYPRGSYDPQRIASQISPDQTSPQARHHMHRSSQSFPQISPQHTSPLTPQLPPGFQQGPNTIHQPMSTPVLSWDPSEMYSSPEFTKTSRGDDSAISSGIAAHAPWLSGGGGGGGLNDPMSSSTISQQSLTSTSINPYGQSPSPHDSTTRASVGPTSNPTDFNSQMAELFNQRQILPVVTIATARRRRKARQTQPHQQGQQQQQDTKKVVKSTSQSRKISKS